MSFEYLVISVVARFWRGASLNGLTVASNALDTGDIGHATETLSQPKQISRVSEPASPTCIAHRSRCFLPVFLSCTANVTAPPLAVGQSRVSDRMDGCALRSISISDLPLSAPAYITVWCPVSLAGSGFVLHLVISTKHNTFIYSYCPTQHRHKFLSLQTQIIISPSSCRTQ